MTEEQYEICIHTREKYMELSRILSRMRHIIRSHRANTWIYRIRLFGLIIVLVTLTISLTHVAERDIIPLRMSTGLPVLIALTTMITFSYALSTNEGSRYDAQYMVGEDLELAPGDMEIIEETYRRLVETKKIYGKILSRCSE